MGNDSCSFLLSIHGNHDVRNSDSAARPRTVEKAVTSHIKECQFIDHLPNGFQKQNYFRNLKTIGNQEDQVQITKIEGKWLILALHFYVPFDSTGNPWHGNFVRMQCESKHCQIKSLMGYEGTILVNFVYELLLSMYKTVRTYI